MTDPTAPDEPPIDRRLAHEHRDLLDGLGRFLDHDAGLREVMQHGEHADLLDDLGSTLDTEAGLAAIIAPEGTAAAPPRTNPAHGKSSPPEPADAAAAIAAADPAARIALRRNPLTQAVIISDLLIRALTIAAKITDYFALPPDRDRSQARKMARDLIRDRSLARDLARARDLAGDLDRALYRDVYRDLDRALARDVYRDLDRDLAHALDFHRDPDRALVSALVSTLAHTRYLARYLDPDLYRDLNHAYAIVRDYRHATGLVFARDSARDLDRALAHARYLAHHAAIKVGQALGIQRLDGLAAALLDGALDDFTDADLADVDLREVDLTGVRWSEAGTVWPTGTDLKALRARSREVEPGVYEITSRGDGRKAPDHVHV